MAKLPPNEQLEFLRKQRATKRQDALTDARNAAKFSTQNKLSGAPKKPFVTGADFRSKIKPIGGAATAGKRLQTQRGK